MFCGPWKGPDFQASITVFERYGQGRMGIGYCRPRLIRCFVKFAKFKEIIR